MQGRLREDTSSSSLQEASLLQVQGASLTPYHPCNILGSTSHRYPRLRDQVSGSILCAQLAANTLVWIYCIHLFCRFRVQYQRNVLFTTAHYLQNVMTYYLVLYLPVNKHTPNNQHTPKISIGEPCSLPLSENKHTCLFLELMFFCKFQFSEPCSCQSKVLQTLSLLSRFNFRQQI